MAANEPVRLLTAQDLRSLGVTLDEVLDLVDQAYRLDAEGKVEVPTKIGVHPDYPGSFLHAMPGWVDGARALGMKWVSYFPGNSERGMEDSTGIIILNHPDHGHPVCIMEGMHVTFLRTAACAAVAARRLLDKAPKTMTLVGCGGLGLGSLKMFHAAFPTIATVHVSSRRPSSREQFCAQMASEVSCELVPAGDVARAIEASDIVISSLPSDSGRPVGGGVMRPGTLFIPLDLTRSWESAVISEASAIVADNAANFVAQVERSHPGTQHGPVMALQDVIAGRAQADISNGPVLVAITGIASTDMVVGWEMYRRAVARDTGTMFRFT